MAAKPDQRPGIVGALKVGWRGDDIFSESGRARSGDRAEVQRQREKMQVTEG